MMIARIVFTFEPEWDHKEHKHLERRVEEYRGSLIPPSKSFDYFTVYKDKGGAVFIPTLNLEKIETFPEEANG